MVDLFKVSASLQILLSVFEAYSWTFDPWNVRDVIPANDTRLFLSIATNAMPHLLLGALSFFPRRAVYCIVYLAYLAISITVSIYLWWLPYLFGIITPQRLWQVHLDFGQSERILPAFPGHPRRPIPPSDDTYRMSLLLIVFLISNLAVLKSPKLTRKHAQLLMLLTALFSFLPIIQYWMTSNQYDSGLVFSLIFPIIYVAFFVVVVWFKTRQNELDSVKAKQE